MADAELSRKEEEMPSVEVDVLKGIEQGDVQWFLKYYFLSEDKARLIKERIHNGFSFPQILVLSSNYTFF